MAYSDFSATDLIRKFGLKFQATELFTHTPEVPPSEWLTEALRKGREQGFASEKSRSERLVTPILLELSDRNDHSFSIYSGMNLDIDEAAGLKGECDFIFSLSRVQDFVSAPIFCLTEAKKQDLEQGTVQCIAQLLGARKLNELEGNAPLPALFGCSTTGVEWRFLKLTDTVVTLDEDRYLITDLGKLLGVLQQILDESRQAVSTTSLKN